MTRTGSSAFPQMETITSDALDAVVGRYDYGAGILTVTREGDKVFAQAGRTIEAPRIK